MNYREAVEAAERRHLIGAYQTPRETSRAESGDGNEARPNREDSLLERMMLKLVENMIDGNKGGDSAGDEKVERLQDQINRLQDERIESRFERLEGLVTQAVNRDPWDEYNKINAMKERLGIGAPVVTDNSPAVQLIKDSTDKMDKNVGRMVGIMERFVLREGDFKPEETRSEDDRSKKADELLETAQARARSRALRKQTFGN